MRERPASLGVREGKRPFPEREWPVPVVPEAVSPPSPRPVDPMLFWRPPLVPPAFVLLSMGWVGVFWRGWMAGKPVAAGPERAPVLPALGAGLLREMNRPVYGAPGLVGVVARERTVLEMAPDRFSGRVAGREAKRPLYLPWVWAAPGAVSPLVARWEKTALSPARPFLGSILGGARLGRRYPARRWFFASPSPLVSGRGVRLVVCQIALPGRARRIRSFLVV